jgi:hypothetical protein
MTKVCTINPVFEQYFNWQKLGDVTRADLPFSFCFYLEVSLDCFWLGSMKRKVEPMCARAKFFSD